MPDIDVLLSLLVVAAVAFSLATSAALFIAQQRDTGSGAEWLPKTRPDRHVDHVETPLLAQQRDTNTNIYEDQDGFATCESMRRFRCRSAISTASTIALQGVGFIISFFDASSAQMSQLKPAPWRLVALWLLPVLWVCRNLNAVRWLLFDAPADIDVESCQVLLTTVIRCDRFVPRRFIAIALGAAANASLLLALLIDLHITWRSKQDHLRRNASVVAQMATVTGAIFLLVTTPRRPNVYRRPNGRIVDGQGSSSILGRWSFSWTERVIRSMHLEALHNVRDIDILPELDYKTRSATLANTFHSQRERHSAKSPHPSLWRCLAQMNWHTLLAAAALVLLSAALGFAPQIFLWKILKALECMENGVECRTASQMMPWVVSLGMTMTLTATVDEWLSWLAQSRLSIPLYAQLASELFECAMHRKETPLAGDQAFEGDDGGGSFDEDVAIKSAEDLADPTPSLVNLVAVDTQRIADFLAIGPVIPITGLKTAISVVFLFELVGWQSLLAGLAAFTVIAPINTRLSAKYGGAQMQLMSQRDAKAAVMTELLHGISQVKFSALESLWIGRVGTLRRRELAAQRRVFALETGLVCIWILAPVLLSAVVLSTFSLIHGGLTASVAFTALSIFGELEIWLAVLPLLFSQLLQAWTSLTRIEQKLREPRVADPRQFSSNVRMDGATIAWPIDSGTDRLVSSMLKKVTVSFPDRALSIIVGKTGSGKSMLLAAILGECDVLEGKVSAPMVALQGVQPTSGMTAPWVISSACAFVAQTPWIRSASVKDNILFELPYDAARYRQVLYACALNHDVQRWPNGDETNLGENGVNLSGGQKWRISLARALYSRAHTIVIDDIFSALDANTARHVCENALVGELSRGRTRILATHHVSLALPYAEYVVHLDNGSVAYAGAPGGWTQSGESSRLPHNPLFTSEPPEEMLDTEQEQQNPREYLEKESHQIGRLSSMVLRRYLKATGGLAAWAFITMGYLGHTTLIILRVGTMIFEGCSG